MNHISPSLLTLWRTCVDLYIDHVIVTILSSLEIIFGPQKETAVLLVSIHTDSQSEQQAHMCFPNVHCTGTAVQRSRTLLSLYWRVKSKCVFVCVPSHFRFLGVRMLQLSSRCVWVFVIVDILSLCQWGGGGMCRE